MIRRRRWRRHARELAYAFTRAAARDPVRRLVVLQPGQQQLTNMAAKWLGAERPAPPSPTASAVARLRQLPARSANGNGQWWRQMRHRPPIKFDLARCHKV
jgi:hypothetical protein